MRDKCAHRPSRKSKEPLRAGIYRTAKLKAHSKAFISKDTCRTSNPLPVIPVVSLIVTLHTEDSSTCRGSWERVCPNALAMYCSPLRSSCEEEVERIMLTKQS